MSNKIWKVCWLLAFTQFPGLPCHASIHRLREPEPVVICPERKQLAFGVPRDRLNPARRKVLKVRPPMGVPRGVVSCPSCPAILTEKKPIEPRIELAARC